jgi:hypothetical protein
MTAIVIVIKTESAAEAAPVTVAETWTMTAMMDASIDGANGVVTTTMRMTSHPAGIVTRTWTEIWRKSA